MKSTRSDLSFLAIPTARLRSFRQLSVDRRYDRACAAEAVNSTDGDARERSAVISRCRAEAPASRAGAARVPSSQSSTAYRLTTAHRSRTENPVMAHGSWLMAMEDGSWLMAIGPSALSHQPSALSHPP